VGSTASLEEQNTQIFTLNSWPALYDAAVSSGKTTLAALPGRLAPFPDSQKM
jgi:hypothetical protein